MSSSSFFCARRRELSRGRGIGRSIAFIALLITPGVRAAPFAAGSPDRGAEIFLAACSGCHGERGDGRSEAAVALIPSPADLTRGIFRYRSTPTGSLPTDADLARTVRFGLPSTAMPAWGGHLAEAQIVDVVAFVKILSPRFARKAPQAPVEISPETPNDADSVARGAEIYKQAQCAKCHGEEGRGDGWAKADELKDDSGQVIRPRDFTTGVYRGGASARDLYRTLATGIDGTPMPAFETLAAGDLWDLVHYTLSLTRPRGFWFWLTNPPSWDEPLASR